MSSSDSSSFPSGFRLWKRPASSSFQTPPSSSGRSGPLQLDIEPPPRSRSVLQGFSLAFVLAFATLQLLPATHFRHPADRSRSWIPFVSDQNAATKQRYGGMIACIYPSRDIEALTNTNDPLIEKHTDTEKHDVKIRRINVVTWICCLDLRVLAVLANSTLSWSRLPENVYFSLYVPESEDMKLSYYKLKVLLPDLNLDLFGQNEVKDKLRIAAPEWESLSLSINELSPFIIPSTKPSLTKFAFVSPDTIIKGSVEELFGIDMGSYAIAATEDCSKRLGDYVNIDILNAIQRTAAKTWISDKPYDQDSCLPDLKLFLVDAAKLDKNFLESILWWNQVLNLKHERNNPEKIVISVALYNKYFKLPGTWKRADPRIASSEGKVLHFDGPTRSCFKQKSQNEPSAFGNIWQQYLPPKSDIVLSN